SGFPVRAASSFFSRATVLLCDRLGLLFEVKALPSRAPAANLPAAWRSQDASDLLLSAGPYFSVLATEELNRRSTKQRAINLLALLVEGGFSQAQEFAMQNGKGVKEGEG